MLAGRWRVSGSGGFKPRHSPFSRTGGAFAIALAPIEISDWFEPDAAGGGAEAARKRALYRDYPETVWNAVEGSEAAQAEALDLVADWAGATVPPDDLPCLLRAALLVRDDLCVLRPTAAGWQLAAASLSSPTFFTAAETVGLTLGALHDPVPGFADQFLTRVVRIFDHLPDDRPLMRQNWTVVNTPEPFSPDPAPSRAEIPRILPEQAADHLFVRVERQALKRLPRTRAVLFSIRVHTESLAEIASDPSRLASFALAWRTATPDFRTYKKLHLYDDLVARLFADHGI